MHRYCNPFHTTIYSLLVALLILASSSVKAALPGSFHAHYHGYRGGSHVADSMFSLKPLNGKWVWHMQTEPIGVYRWLTSKKPFQETRMGNTANGLQLEQLFRGDYPDRPPQQSSWFDHQQGIVHFSDNEKKRQARLNFDGEIFTNHSIHLLYRDMKDSGEQVKSVRYFKKGNLYEATLELERAVEISHGSEKSQADRLSHKVAGSNKELVYYYAGHDLAPLCIEQYKNGKLNNMMWRVSLDQP